MLYCAFSIYFLGYFLLKMPTLNLPQRVELIIFVMKKGILIRKPSILLTSRQPTEAIFGDSAEKNPSRSEAKGNPLKGYITVTVKIKSS